MIIDLNKISVQDLLDCNQKLSEADTRISSIYHMIELLDVDAVIMVKLYKQLREALTIRRYWKEIKSISQSMQVEKINIRSGKRELQYKKEAEDELRKFKTSLHG